MADVNTSGFDTGFIRFKESLEGDQISDRLKQELERRAVIYFEQKTTQQNVLAIKKHSVPQSVSNGQSSVVFSWSQPFSNTNYVAAVVVTSGGNKSMLLRETGRTATSVTYSIENLTAAAELRVNVIGV